MGATSSAVVLVGLLHVIPPSSDVNPARRTISEYALLETGWVFDTAVLALSAGSIATFAALVFARVITVAAGSSICLLLWSVSLAAVVYFPKHNWSVGPSLDGHLHRVAGLVAFLSLPVAALLAARVGLSHPHWHAHASWSRLLGLWSLLCFSPIAVAILLQPVTGIRWWRAIPLGAVERLLAISEVAIVLALGWWAARASRLRDDAGPVSQEPQPR
jgi:hypothetical protein